MLINISSQSRLMCLMNKLFYNEQKIIFNETEKLVPQERMDIDLPGYAWDLLPF